MSSPEIEAIIREQSKDGDQEKKHYGTEPVVGHIVSDGKISHVAGWFRLDPEIFQTAVQEALDSVVSGLRDPAERRQKRTAGPAIDSFGGLTVEIQPPLPRLSVEVTAALGSSVLDYLAQNGGGKLESVHAIASQVSQPDMSLDVPAEAQHSAGQLVKV